MCGRFVSATTPQLIADYFDASVIKASLEQPNFNIAPSLEIPTIVERIDKDTQEQTRALTLFKWGLVPSWAKDIKIGFKLNNARSETALEKPAFRKAMAKRRCLIPADGFYEWLRIGEKPKDPKFPYFIHHVDGTQLAFAGLYEIWRDPEGRDDVGINDGGINDAQLLRTCTILTTHANEVMSHVHDRMPVMIDRKDWNEWLDPLNEDAAPLTRLFNPRPSREFELYRVSKAVNNARSAGSELLRPLTELEPEAAQAAIPVELRIVVDAEN